MPKYYASTEPYFDRDSMQTFRPGDHVTPGGGHLYVYIGRVLKTGLALVRTADARIIRVPHDTLVNVSWQ